MIAQFGENYHNNIARVDDGKKEISLVVDWQRAGKCFISRLTFFCSSSHLVRLIACSSSSRIGFQQLKGILLLVVQI